MSDQSSEPYSYSSNDSFGYTGDPGYPPQAPGMGADFGGYGTQPTGYPQQPPAAFPVPTMGYSPYPMMGMPNPSAPYGYDPMTGLPFSDKSKVAAGLLGIFLGMFGVGRFYMGQPGMGIAQILVTWLTLGFGYLWPFIDGIVILAGRPTDGNGLPLH